MCSANAKAPFKSKANMQIIFVRTALTQIAFESQLILQTVVEQQALIIFGRTLQHLKENKKEQKIRYSSVHIQLTSILYITRRHNKSSDNERARSVHTETKPVHRLHMLCTDFSNCWQLRHSRHTFEMFMCAMYTLRMTKYR